MDLWRQIEEIKTVMSQQLSELEEGGKTTASERMVREAVSDGLTCELTPKE